MLNRNKILMMAVMGVIANLPSANAQTFYQCMPKKCGANEVMSNGFCYSANSYYSYEKIYFFNKPSDAGTLKLENGTYVVSMKGGSGGGPSGSIQPGGSVNYKFTVTCPNSTTCYSNITYAVGQDGVKCTSGNCTSFSYGGGGGSWISIDGKYIVAGGGGGYGEHGGAGGAIGGGSSGWTRVQYSNDCSLSNNDYYNYYKGGVSGYDYAGGSVLTTKKRCHIYIFDDNNDSYDYYACFPGQGINDANAGQCIRLLKEHSNWDNHLPDEIAQGGRADGIILYPGFGNIKVGGDAGQPGSATHATNVPGEVFHYGSSIYGDGFIVLYKFKY